ncbi:SGNH/GDSL hydrolase family protein [Rhizobium ruizarguesonis]
MPLMLGDRPIKSLFLGSTALTSEVFVGDKVIPVELGPPLHPTWMPDPARYMPAATRTRWPTGSTTNPWLYTAGLNYHCSKLFFGSPDYPTNDFLVPFVGFALTEGGNAPQETQSPATDMLIDEAFFVHPDGTEYPILFNGSAAATVTAATGIVYGQITLPAALPAWSIFGIRTVYHGNVGDAYCAAYRCQRHRGEKFWAAADLAAIRALATTNGPSSPEMDPDNLYNILGNATNSQKCAYGPALVLAKGWDGRPVPLVVGDSLIERQEIAASADVRGNMGMWRRWFDQRDRDYGSYIPLVMGVPGEHNEYELATNSTKRWVMIDYIRDTYNNGKDIWTCVADVGGRNDTNATTSLWQSRKFGLDDRILARYPGAHMVGATILPTMAGSADAGRTVAGFSATTATWNPVTGQLATVNASILSSTKFAKTIDIVPAYMSDTDPTKAAAAELFPLGNVVGHPGNQDGVTNWNTIRLPSTVLLGARVMFEYQPGLWTSRTLVDKTDLGDGTADFRVAEVLATNVQDNATLLGHAFTVSDYIHPALYAVLRFVKRLSQTHKEKLHSPVLSDVFLTGTPMDTLTMAVQPATYRFVPTSVTRQLQVSDNGSTLWTNSGTEFSGTTFTLGTLTGKYLRVIETAMNGTTPVKSVSKVVGPVAAFVALPSTPLAAGEMLGAIGDSYIGYNNIDFNASVPDTTSGRAAFNVGIGFIEWAKRLDPRFRVDQWFDTSSPLGINTSGFNNAKPGDHLAFSGAGFLGGILPRLDAFLQGDFKAMIFEGGSNTISSGDDGQSSLAYMIAKFDAGLTKIRKAGKLAIVVKIPYRGDWPADDARHAKRLAFNAWIDTQATRNGIAAILDFDTVLAPGGVQNLSMYLSDKIHPNPKGARAIGEDVLLPVIQSLFASGTFIDLNPANNNLAPVGISQLNGGTAGTWANTNASRTGTGQVATGVAINVQRNVRAVASLVDIGGGAKAQRLDYTPLQVDANAYFELFAQSISIPFTLDETKWYRAMCEVETFDGTPAFVELRHMVRQGTTDRSSGFSGRRLSSDTFTLSIGRAGVYKVISEPFRWNSAWGTADRVGLEIRLTGPNNAPPSAFQFSKIKVMDAVNPVTLWGF